MFYAGRTGAVGLDAATGGELWRVTLPSSATFSSVAAFAGVVYFGTDQEIFALDAATGQTVWRTAIGPDWIFRSRVRGVSAGADRVFVNLERFLSVNGAMRLTYVVALDRNTGATVWTNIEGSGDRWNAPGAAPLMTEDRIVFGDVGENSYVALDRSSGALAWRVLGERGFFGPTTPPTLAGDTLFGASADGALRAISLSTGRVFWASKEGTGSLDAHVLCGDRILTAGGSGVNVHDRATGKLLVRGLLNGFGPADSFLQSVFAARGNSVYFFTTTHTCTTVEAGASADRVSVTRRGVERLAVATAR